LPLIVAYTSVQTCRLLRMLSKVALVPENPSDETVPVDAELVVWVALAIEIVIG
jgi:hypothetical protein